MVRRAYELHSQNNDFAQADTLVREIWNHALRAEFVANVTGHLLASVKGEVLEKAFDYRKERRPRYPASRSRRTSGQQTAPDRLRVSNRRPRPCPERAAYASDGAQVRLGGW